ncbi:MAG: capsule assembly Wzi family protein [Prevotellaceae bacterium]|jgi:hypothetical protein|nr:capsule assembly Wzi family protein [Prevotellaceae bacterium]
MKKYILVLSFFLGMTATVAQEIPQHISYTRIYGFIDELANDGIIEINSVVKPYSRAFIAGKLREAATKTALLNRRQKSDLTFFLNDYALENDTLPQALLNWTNRQTASLALLQPAFHYRNNHFKARITPILGMHLLTNKKGMISKRWYGAEVQADIVNHVSIWGSIRDISLNGNRLKESQFPTLGERIAGAKITQPGFLNTLQGHQYKEANYGGDYSDSRGGIKAYTWWGSVGLQKDNIVWGDNNNGSNILSGRAPSFAMLTLNLKPVRWFELNYIHGWLVSNILDSARYYSEELPDGTVQHKYRQKNKFIAANMFTFTPVAKLNLSLGNAVIYAEDNVQAAYFIPIAFFKSIDHTMTKGLGIENQNSQVFFNFSSRNIKHLHLYTSIYIDEIQFSRFKPSNKQNNPISYKVGFNLSNFPLKNLSLTAEFTRSNIINYAHSIPVLEWSSNSYGMGHYLGDNAQEIYLAINYKPIRSLNINLAYTDATKYNTYDYLRSNILNIISQKPFNEKTWRNQIATLNVLYEVFNNVYAVIDVAWNNAKGYDLTAYQGIDGEHRLTAQEYLDAFSPKFYQGNNLTFTCGLSFNF